MLNPLYYNSFTRRDQYYFLIEYTFVLCYTIGAFGIIDEKWIQNGGYMQIRLKVWLEIDGEYIFGDGRAELLRLVGQFRSISKAASSLKMSYRHAWGQIRKLEERLGDKLVETCTGGKGGGKACLTETAEELLSKYDEFRDGIDLYVQEKYKKSFGVSAYDDAVAERGRGKQENK
jgi:molybdate transport system regulatory protein